jgi:hypothetical protein
MGLCKIIVYVLGIPDKVVLGWKRLQVPENVLLSERPFLPN